MYKMKPIKVLKIVFIISAINRGLRNGKNNKMILFLILLSVTLVNNIICSAINEHDINTLQNYDDVSKRYLGASRSAFDQSLYDDVNEELCQKQLTYLVNSSLRWDFLDASAKLPSGLKTGNINDLGDYFQCLSIHHIEEESEMDIQGKYCNVYVPLDQPINIPEIPQIPDLPEFPWPLPNQTMTKFKDFNRIKMFALSISGISSDIATRSRDDPATRTFPSLAISNVLGAYGVCVPRACSPRQAIEFFQSRLPFVNVTFYENYCRLPGDKPFSGADYTAMAIFGILGVLIIISTAYDVYQTIILKQDQSLISPLYRCFSVYTNTRRFLTFKSPPGALECVDGIRSISMMWVVVGHVYSMTLLGYIHNIFDVLAWMTNFSSTWINSAPITVDTFFLMSGILVVYTTVGKISRDRFIKSIHLFIINRLLRMFPLLAAVVLLQASVVNHLSDGPFWNNVAIITENCRNYWWSALLHVQNYVNPNEICLIQTWYLSVDVQLYIISPLILVFLFGSQRKAWIALSVILIASLASSTAYSFSYNFSAALANPGRIMGMMDYTSKYYYNTLCRAPPFFVGMLYGYIIHQWRDRKLKIPKMYLRILWLLSFVLMAFCIFTIYPVMQVDHDQQTFDNFLNAYMRAIWAVGLGWLIFACVKGYGGPINWFLSLNMWKLIARLSFAMYLIHVPIILVANGSWTKTYYFSEGNNLHRFAAEFTLTFLAAFVLSICIDAPFSTLQKLLLGGGAKKRPQNPLPKIAEPEIVEVVHPAIHTLRKRDSDIIIKTSL